MFKFLKKNDPIAAFWQWFEKNRSFYEELGDDRLGEHLDPIYQGVVAISPGLAVEMSRRDTNGVRDLVISANGDVDLFPVVSEIVEKAPRFNRWSVTAFRPRMPEASVLKVNDGLEFNMKKMFFAASEDEGELDVFIFVENIKDKDERQVFGFGMIMIDNLLGEYDCATKVRGFAFRDLDDAPEDWPLNPLIELPETVDEFHRRSNN
jgi:hypothetical protein